MRFFLFFALLALISLFSCVQDRPSGAQDASADESHVRMVAILDSIARNADPVTCYNQNGKLADLIAAQMNTLPPEKRMAAQFRYGEQLLYAGKVEAATMQILDVVQQIKDNLNPETKLVYDMLALCFLRLGEVQNCVENQTNATCILPIQPEGVYKLKAGPENAIAVLERLLKKFPDDMQSRWLLNIAYMNLGKWPNGVPAAYRIPTNLFASTGAIEFKNIASEVGLDCRGLSGGVCTEDFDNDGDIDLFVTSYGLTDQCRFFVNNGDGSFTERTKEANLTGIVSGLNTLHCDYDNDGDADITILRGAWLDGGTHPNSLLRNNGDGTFTDVTIASGMLSFHPTQCGAWADYDGDGWLDLYIANESRRNASGQMHPNELYHNNRNGTFTNVAAKLNLNFTGFFKGITWGDINNDQRPDMMLTMYGGPCKLVVNRGGTAPDRWIFEDIAQRAGITNSLLNFPTWFFDYDNDGFSDILVSGYKIDPAALAGGEFLKSLTGKSTNDEYIKVHHNNGNETFTEVGPALGLKKNTFAMGSNFGDLDNDGWLDFYLGTGTPELGALVPNRMFRNVDGKRFEEITFNGFAHVQKGHGVAFADMDNDGDEDIYEVMGGAYEGDLANNILFENPGNDNSWVELVLEGKTANRCAIMARVAVHVKNADGSVRTIWNTCGTGGSFGSGSLRMEIGLGKAASIESVDVYWPLPKTPKETFTGLKPGGIYRLTQGAGKAVDTGWKVFVLKK